MSGLYCCPVVGSSARCSCRPDLALPPSGRRWPGWRSQAGSCGGCIVSSATRSRSARTGPRSRWCCSRIPDAVREIFRLDPAIAPAGRAGSSCVRSPESTRSCCSTATSTCASAGCSRGRSTASGCARSTPAIAELARARAVGLERAGGRARADARADARDHPAGRVRRATAMTSGPAARASIESALATVRSMPQILGDGPDPARPRAAQPVGPVPGRGRSGSTRCCSTSSRAGARSRRRDRARCPEPAARAARRARQPARLTATSATSSSPCWWAATTARPLRWPGRSNASPATPTVHARLRDGDPAYLDAVVKEVLRARPALTIAPRLLLEPVRIAGPELPGRHPGRRLPVAGDAARGPVAPGAGVPRPSAGSKARSRTRCRGSRSAAGCAAAPARRSPRWRCARCCGRGPT